MTSWNSIVIVIFIGASKPSNFRSYVDEAC